MITALLWQWLSLHLALPAESPSGILNVLQNHILLFLTTSNSLVQRFMIEILTGLLFTISMINWVISKNFQKNIY
jgi:hypothetical protein